MKRHWRRLGYTSSFLRYPARCSCLLEQKCGRVKGESADVLRLTMTDAAFAQVSCENLPCSDAKGGSKAGD